ncbi:MAG: flagellar basal body rod protein FlgC [Sphingomonadaceae bacterium]|uniref:flagellar basal body rod protein FlgC n=1 Tax=Thermaurantiacus sp. TaxID=2820283 RepID=UPI00298F0938|nr:flagellar basal body rod protein FlgC [Thermaurantiacus sp.]MCS6985891.1 flagellar basal body rod protein FlgC [Sphingomonadaceae bacterium]MDW8414893.1 flagellar basal body rod protein FlgC [Thermaurantiacus sp.]
MGPFSLFEIAGRAMSAQLVRLNTTASNLANAGAVAGSAETAFRPLKPVFRTLYDGASGRATVDVAGVVAARAEPGRRHEPGHPLADAQGYVFTAAVDPFAELVEMVETARQFQNSIEVLETGKALMLETLRLGR